MLYHSVLAVLVLVSCGCHTVNEPPVQTITLALGKDASKGSGLAWPEGESEWAIEDESFVKIVFPQEGNFETRSRVTFLSRKDGILCRIEVSPLAEASSFEECRERIENLAKQLSISRGHITDSIEKWKMTEPKWKRFAIESTGGDIDDETTVFIKCTPGAIKDTWHMSFEFYAKKHYKSD
jgi:hypothetical protein